MKTIRLSRGLETKVDDEDYEELSKYKWHAIFRRSGYYAERSEWIKGGRGKQIHIKMHRVIMNTPDGLEVDHINGDTLDNQKCNMRNCTTTQNAYNRSKQSNNKSGYKGIRFHKWTGTWHAQIVVNGRQMSLRYWHTKEEAARAYNEAALKYHGAFAKLNIIP